MSESRFKCKAMCNASPLEIEAICDITKSTWQEVIQKRIDKIVSKKEAEVVYGDVRWCNVEDKQNIKTEMWKHYLHDKFIEYRYSVDFDIPFENVINGRIIV